MQAPWQAAQSLWWCLLLLSKRFQRGWSGGMACRHEVARFRRYSVVSPLFTLSHRRCSHVLLADRTQLCLEAAWHGIFSMLAPTACGGPFGTGPPPLNAWYAQLRRSVALLPAASLCEVPPMYECVVVCSVAAIGYRSVALVPPLNQGEQQARRR